MITVEALEKMRLAALDPDQIMSECLRLRAENEDRIYAEWLTTELTKAGICEVDVIIEGDKARFHKRALSYEMDKEAPIAFMAHKLGWHKFD